MGNGQLGILVVDDVAANCLALEAALAPLQRDVVCVHSGREALLTLLRRDFAVILIDVQMPEMDGFETAQLIRGRGSLRRTPIIFVTGHGSDAPGVRRAYQLGVVDFLLKPIDPDILRAKVQVFLDLDDQARELRHAQDHAHEQALEAQRRQIEAAALVEADRRKDEFLAILAHELRNPLAPLRTSIELLARDPNRFSPRMVDIMGRQVSHLAHLVDDLLDVSRITAGKIELRREPVVLSDIVEDALAASRPLVDARRHTLIVDLGTESPVVQGDPVRLVQVVSNLVNNAAKYTPPGGRIEVALTNDGPEATIVVTDTGRGIPSDLLGRVFDMFVQERAGLDGEGGLGLGLALVRRLTELHGGTVAVASAGAGAGSSFTVRLPATGTSPRRSTNRTAPLPPMPEESRRLRAVVVEDNEDLRELVADMLSSFGHEVVTAEDGAAGLALIREKHPDVALVDIGLPVLDGYQVARTLRAEPVTRGLRLVAMTGHGTESDAARARDAGFDAHIVKPATASTILAILGARAP